MEPVTEKARPWWALPYEYQRHRVVGILQGAFRVLSGKNASIPKGFHNTGTALGIVEVRGYYGGCRISLPEGDLYWGATDFDGWGAGPGQRKFDDLGEVST